MVLGPASVRLTCTKCHRKFTRPQGTNRKRCFSCSPQRLRTVPADEVAAATPPGDAPVGVVDAVESALDDAGTLGSWTAAAALDLARSIDRGGHSGSQLAALHAQLRTAMEAALARPQRTDDAVDELTARAAKRFGA